MECLYSPRALLKINPVPKRPKHIFSWLTSTFHLQEDYLVKKVGLDATMHIRFLRMVVHFLTFQTLVICPVLLVLHWRGTQEEDATFLEQARNESDTPLSTTIDHFRSNSTLYYLSIANVPNKHSILYTHVFFIYLTSLVWLWLLFVNHIHHLELLRKNSDEECGLHERSILLTHVPPHLRDTTALLHHFERAQVGTVESVVIVSNRVIQTLDEILKKRSKVLNHLEMALIDMAKKKGGVHSDDDGSHEKWLLCLSKMEPNTMEKKEIQGLILELEGMDMEIVRLRDASQSPEYYTPTGAAFVTFKSAHSAQICAQIVTSWKPGVFTTRMAPEPRDLLWRSLLRRGRKDRIMGKIRHWIVFAAVWTLTIFWLFPITFILGLSSIQSLSQHFSFLRYFLASSLIVRSFIQNILPTLLVTLFMSLLPWILQEISRQQDFVSYSDLEDTVLRRYYHFAIFNVLIVFLLGTTFLTTMLDVLYEPTMLIQLLANSLPQGANFFLNYVLFNATTHAMELVQLGSQLFGHLFFTLPFISCTPRMRMQRTAPWSFPYYYYYPNHILVLVITVTYSVIQPLILIFALFYFTFALLVYRHQFLYCYLRRYETRGTRHYRRIVRYTSDGLLIFQFTMVGLLYLKGILPAATALLPLIIFTVYAKIKFQRLFRSKSKHPYVGKFGSETAGRRPSSSPYWQVIDDVWKFSYIKEWWESGRYAPAQEEEGENTVTKKDFEDFDYILCMDEMNLRDLKPHKEHVSTRKSHSYDVTPRPLWTKPHK
ncbi:DUF221-domain-containing protein [Backusella circina FSU 941]|nr:DUF221-domain-containing protein [Backusella circina FSU 941]